MADSPSFFPITDCGIYHWTDWAEPPISNLQREDAHRFNSDQTPGDGPMKTHFIVLGTVLLSTALLFGIEVGITALVLNFS